MYRLVKYFPHCQPAVYCGHSRVNNSSSLLGGGQASYCPSPWIGPRLTCSTFGKTPYLRPIHPEKKKQEWSFLTFEMRQGIDICPGPKKTELCTKCDFRAKICRSDFLQISFSDHRFSRLIGNVQFVWEVAFWRRQRSCQRPIATFESRLLLTTFDHSPNPIIFFKDDPGSKLQYSPNFQCFWQVSRTSIWKPSGYKKTVKVP